MEFPARCYDREGYLVRQSLMTEVPYGCRTVAQKGCGFMAVYNAAKYFAQPVTETEVWQFFHENVFLRGIMGTTVGHVCAGAHRFGMRVTGVRYRELMGAKAGILWYHTGKSRHFIFLHRCADGRYAFPNSGAAEPMAFPAFYEKYVRHLRLSPLHLDLPIMFTLTLGRRRAPRKTRSGETK